MRMLLVAAVAATIFSAGFAHTQDNPEKVTVAYLLEWPTANQAAQVEGAYGMAMGVPVEWRAFGDGNEMSRALAAGEVQIAYSQGLVPFVVAVSNGLPLRLVGIAVSYGEADNCIVRDDSGITRENARELEGKTVASPVGNVTHYKLLRTLDHLGVDASRVSIVEMDGADAAVALQRGDVVMACAFGGPVQRMKEVGRELMTAEEQEAIGIRVFDVVSTTERFAERYPGLLRAFMEVTETANAAYRADPERYQETIAKAAGMDLDATKEMLGMFSFPSAEEQKSAAWLGGAVQAFTKEVADFFVEQGQLDRALDSYEFAMDPSFL